MATTEPLEVVKQRIEEVTPEEAQRSWPPVAVLLDTREPHEPPMSYIEGCGADSPGRRHRQDRRGRPRQGAAGAALLPLRQPLRPRRPSCLESLAMGTSPRSRAGSSSGRSRACRWSSPGADAEQRMRYSRHTLLPEVGVEGQVKLLNAKVLLIGAGGLGSPAALYLAAAGIGTLGIIDDDVVDESNLQRQVIHTTERVGMPKTESARVRSRRSTPTSRWSSTASGSAPTTSSR